MPAAGPEPQPSVKALTTAPGVVGHSGPYPVIATVLEANGRTVVAQTEGRDTTAAAVDQPKLTEGGWVRAGGVVLEAAFADALGVCPGDRITPDAARHRHEGPERRRSAAAGAAGRSGSAGVAVTAAAPPYPETACLANLCPGGADAGLVWLTRADALQPRPARAGPCVYVLNLKLADPATAPAFAARAQLRPSHRAGHALVRLRRPRSCSRGRRSARRAPTSSRTSGEPC